MRVHDLKILNDFADSVVAGDKTFEIRNNDKGYKNAIECYTREYTIRKSNIQYDKAIDDFVHECDKCCGFYSGKNKSITREDIFKIAEQLQKG